MNTADRIDEILDHFDFAKVHRAMVALDWRWGDERVPSVADLRKCARSLLRGVAEADEWAASSTGGFRAARSDDGALHLSFRVDDVGVDMEGNPL